MNSRHHIGALFLSLTTLLCAAKSFAAGPTPAEARARALVNYARLPLSFEENRGQAGARVKFLSQGGAYSILLAPSEVSLCLQPAGEGPRPSTIRMSFPGANPSPSVAGAEPQSALSSYFIGNDPARWVTGARNFARVRYGQLYPGVDLAFYGNQGQLEYDFVVAPRRSPKAIRLQFDGVDGMRLDRTGDLVLRAANGEIRQHRPVVYQEGAGGRHAVEGHYVIESRNRVSFAIARYDHRKALIIDPALTFGTYLGSPKDDVFSISAAASTANYPAVAADLQGNIYVAGYNGGTAANFTGHPATLGAGSKVFVVKMNPTGTTLIYSVVFGGTQTDIAGGIAVDLAGNAYITGSTNSINFPVTAGVPQGTLNGGTNAFVTALNTTGTGLVYSTFLGGSGIFAGNAIAVDFSGNAYVTGLAAQSGPNPFPLANPLSGTPSAGFLTEFKAGGAGYVYSTYLAAGIGYGIAVNNAGEAYLTGSTGSRLSPSPAQGYVLKVSALGTGVAYGPQLLGNTGKTLQTVGFGIALDTQNNAYVAGMTNDPSFPQIRSAAQATYGGGLTDGFALKLDSGGNLVYGTYIGGLGTNLLPERGSGIGVDFQGNVYVTGTTQCITGFPNIDPLSAARNGSAAVLMKGAINGLSSNWTSTGLAGPFDQVTALAFDANGNLYAGTGAVNAAGGGIYKLATGSNTWVNANSGIPSSTIDAIAADPNSASTVYAAANTQLFQTTNGGTSWRQLAETVGALATMAIAKTSPSTIYVGSTTGLIYSTNAGSTWNGPLTPPPAGAINAVIVDPNNSKTAYAGTPTGVYQTVNGGIAWIGVNNGLPTVPGGNTPLPVTSLAINPSTRTIYAATANGLFYTTNAGASWTQAKMGQQTSTPLLVAVDANNNVYVAFQGAGMATGINGGTLQSNWSALTYNGLTQNPVLALVAPPTGPGAYAGIVAATTAFLTELSPSGAFLSSTCIGGSDNNLGQAISVTAGGEVAVSGLTAASNFPATSGAIQTSSAGGIDAFALGIAGEGNSVSPPTVVIQTPVSGTIFDGTATFSGYALDTFSPGASAISSVQVWLDGNFLTTATYGISNSAACAPYPDAPGCPNVGFTYQFASSSLSPGPHALSFYAFDSGTPQNIGAAGMFFTVRSGPPIPGDFNGGPGPDVIWEDPNSGFAQIWYLGGAQGVTLTGAANLTQTNPWHIVAVADFDGNGTPDVVWQDPVSGAVQVWYLGGPGGNVLISAANITNKNPWHVVSVADFNRDGHPDLLWEDPTSGFSQIWYLGGPQGLTLLGDADLDQTNPWHIVGTGDFNADGFPDVLWQDPKTGTVQIWYMGGTTPGQEGSQLQSALNLTANAWHVVAIADFNQDGHPDVVFESPTNGAAQVFFYTGTKGTTFTGSAVLSGPNPWYIAGPH